MLLDPELTYEIIHEFKIECKRSSSMRVLLRVPVEKKYVMCTRIATETWFQSSLQELFTAEVEKHEQTCRSKPIWLFYLCL